MIRIFTGFDEREAAGWHVFCESLLEHASQPVQIIPITRKLAGRIATQAGQGGQGTNAFTRSRFLVPELCGYEGWAIFADGADMLVRSDIAELWAYRLLGGKDVWCVKHDYETKHAHKYLGTAMEAPNVHYWRKNWASLFLIDCGSKSARSLKPHLIEQAQLSYLLGFSWVEESCIGAIPNEWNWLIREMGRNDAAKIAHYTLGIPGFARYRDSDFSKEWFGYAEKMQRGIQEAL